MITESNLVFKCTQISRYGNLIKAKEKIKMIKIGDLGTDVNLTKLREERLGHEGVN